MRDKEIREICLLTRKVYFLHSHRSGFLERYRIGNLRKKRKKKNGSLTFIA
jgi:hypothetical protein